MTYPQSYSLILLHCAQNVCLEKFKCIVVYMYVLCMTINNQIQSISINVYVCVCVHECLYFWYWLNWLQSLTNPYLWLYNIRFNDLFCCMCVVWYKWSGTIVKQTNPAFVYLNKIPGQKENSNAFHTIAIYTWLPFWKDT